MKLRVHAYFVLLCLFGGTYQVSRGQEISGKVKFGYPYDFHLDGEPNYLSVWKRKSGFYYSKDFIYDVQINRTLISIQVLNKDGIKVSKKNQLMFNKYRFFVEDLLLIEGKLHIFYSYSERGTDFLNYLVINNEGEVASKNTLIKEKRKTLGFITYHDGKRWKSIRNFIVKKERSSKNITVLYSLGEVKRTDYYSYGVFRYDKVLAYYDSSFNLISRVLVPTSYGQNFLTYESQVYFMDNPVYSGNNFKASTGTKNELVKLVFEGDSFFEKRDIRVPDSFTDKRSFFWLLDSVVNVFYLDADCKKSILNFAKIEDDTMLVERSINIFDLISSKLISGNDNSFNFCKLSKSNKWIRVVKDSGLYICLDMVNYGYQSTLLFDDISHAKPTFQSTQMVVLKLGFDYSVKWIEVIEKKQKAVGYPFNIGVYSYINDEKLGLVFKNQLSSSKFALEQWVEHKNGLELVSSIDSKKLRNPRTGKKQPITHIIYDDYFLENNILYFRTRFKGNSYLTKFNLSVN